MKTLLIRVLAIAALSSIALSSQAQTSSAAPDVYLHCTFKTETSIFPGHAGTSYYTNVVVKGSPNVSAVVMSFKTLGLVVDQTSITFTYKKPSGDHIYVMSIDRVSGDAFVISDAEYSSGKCLKSNRQF